MRRRGRSTSMPSSVAWTPASCVGHLLPQMAVFAQLLRLDAADRALGLGHQAVELFVGTDVQVPETIEELGQVLDSAVPKHLGLAVFLAAEPLGQVRNQFGQLFGECLLGQSHRFVEASLHPPAFLPVELGAELLQVRRWIDAGKIPARLQIDRAATQGNRPD